MKRLITMCPAVNLLVLALLSCFVASSADAANRYVRSGASGAANGSDWTNAYPSLPATLTRGDTYYVAAGNYSGYRFGTATSGTALVTIKKATAADHGTDTGWNNAFGTGQALFTGRWDIGMSNILIDGQTGGGPGSWTTGFGFKVLNTGNDTVIDVSGDNVTLRHIEAQGNGGDGDGVGRANHIIGVGGADSLTISYAYLYDAGACIYMVSGTNLLFEYNYTGYMESTSAQHAEIASIWAFSVPVSNVTYRYNVFTHAEGTGGLIMEGNGLYVYGNVFYKPAGDNWSHGNGLIGTWTVNTLTNLKVYNNTFININSGNTIGTLFTAPTTGNEARNNIFYGVTNIGGLGTLLPAFSHNHYVDTNSLSLTETGKTTATGNPFVNFSALDFRLKAPTASGMALPAPYNRDMFGNVRGSDGSWDRGAVEFGGTSTSGPTAPGSLSLN